MGMDLLALDQSLARHAELENLRVRVNRTKSIAEEIDEGFKGCDEGAPKGDFSERRDIEWVLREQSRF